MYASVVLVYYRNFFYQTNLAYNPLDHLNWKLMLSSSLAFWNSGRTLTMQSESHGFESYCSHCITTLGEFFTRNCL